jgi:sterol desaturase/sphingolipid hydroxylase (fatty acid hydroxylase superfamily)
MDYLYPISLAIISAAVALAERLVPWRGQQRQLRPGLWSDLVFLVFNGHFLGVIVYGLSLRYLAQPFDAWLLQLGLHDVLYREVAAGWPLWLQIVVALLATDFIQWCVHNLLHRVGFLWHFHQTHHSVRDGEMDWIVSFRFQWTEVILYRAVQYLPLAYLGFDARAVMFHAIFGTAIGHLNHANLNLSYGPLRYLLNNPRMHLWHHDFESTASTTVNFGIIFSLWDWVFGTAKLPDTSPARIGFPGVEAFPRGFFGRTAWPLQRLLRLERPDSWVYVVVVLAVLAAAWWLHDPTCFNYPGAAQICGGN